MFVFLFILALGGFTISAPTARAAGNAGYTTFDTTLLGCLDSPNGVDCNNYANKSDVFMNGGPTGGNGLANGNYYFAVLTPGSQNGGFIDGATGNLSDTTVGGTTGDLGSGDAVSNRTFTVTNGLISSYGGTHATGTSPDGKFIIQLMPYDDTDNPGGVYILAICQVGATSPSQCKYDAFKVKPVVTPPPQPLAVVKNATPSFDRKFTWQIQKDVDKTRVEQIGGTATFNYTVTVSHDNGTDSNWQVNGMITVLNPNDDAVTGVDITDSVDNGGTCVVTGGTGLTVPGNGSVTVSYTCTYSSSPSPASGTNTATATWPTQTLLNGQLDGGSASFAVGFDFGSVSPNLIDNCVAVTDSVDGGAPVTLGTVCVGDPNPTTFTFSLTFSVPQFNCVDHTNTATFTTNTTGTTGSASKTVTVCGPAKTGALTMGFWQNKNGQGIIANSGPSSGTCTLTGYLRQFNPFQDLSATAPCGSVGSTSNSNVVGYVYNVIKNAACTSTSKTCNSMLKAQMLATALDVYFSAPTSDTTDCGAVACGGNKISAPAPIGGVKIDLTMICVMIDGTGGTATCSGTFQDVSNVFGVSSPGCLKVIAMLLYANADGTAFSNGNPVSNSGGTTWYNQNKTKQVQAKNAFDAINNQVAFSCP